MPSTYSYAQDKLKSAPDILALPSPKLEDDGTYESEVTPNKATPAILWRREALKLRQQSQKNTAAQNANIWLQLSQSRLNIPLHDPKTDEQRPAWSDLVRALPAPEQWAQLLKQAHSNYVQSPSKVNALNWYFAARLQNDSKQQTEALRAAYGLIAPRYEAGLKRYPITAPPTRFDYALEEQKRKDLEEFSAFAEILHDSPSRDQQAIGFKWKLEITPRMNGYQMFSLPDLVTQFGEGAATPFLQKILLSKTRVYWYSAGKTTLLAQKIWLSDKKFQTKPQWELVRSAQDWKFALATLDKFPKINRNDSDFGDISQVRSYALSGLIKTGNYALASQKVDSWLRLDPKSALVGFPYLEHNETYDSPMKTLLWVESMLKRHPQLSWWGGYGALAFQLDETPRYLKTLQNLVGQKGFQQLPSAQRYSYLSSLSAAYLNVGDVKNGGDTLVRAIQIDLNDKNFDQLNDDVTSLLRLTRLFPNAAWSKEAQKGAKLLFSAQYDQGDNFMTATSRVRIALRLTEQKSAALAQSLLIEALRADLKARANQKGYFYDSRSSRSYLYGLMEIYHQANRPADMVYLVEKATGWGQEELTPLLTFDGSQEWEYDVENPESKTKPTLGYLTAWALAKTNRRAQAVQVTHALIERRTGYDAAYRLLCDLQGESSRPFLKKLAATDRYEERPLIWQAYLSRRAGQWKQAQQLAQQAISIDPSDGEQGPNDRMRAYSELAAALRGEKKPEEAAKVEAAVRSIRLAEKADYLRIAGLTTSAINLYKKSLDYFDDAYCIQSRLAVQLTGIGRYDEAAQHFRRAYELMPVSFGRLESHCFGCEGVFGGKKQNSIARQVFLQLEKARPNDPKVAYLAGYWRSTAQQKETAIPYYEKAVQLDPLYLSAWKQLNSSSELLTPRQSDRVTLKLIQLDPRGIHNDYYGEGVSYEVKGDYRGLWKTTESVLPRKSPQANANFPLRASTRDENGESYNTWLFVKKPADAIAGQGFISHISKLMN